MNTQTDAKGALPATVTCSREGFVRAGDPAHDIGQVTRVAAGWSPRTPAGMTLKAKATRREAVEVLVRLAGYSPLLRSW